MRNDLYNGRKFSVHVCDSVLIKDLHLRIRYVH